MTVNSLVKSLPSNYFKNLSGKHSFYGWSYTLGVSPSLVSRYCEGWVFEDLKFKILEGSDHHNMIVCQYEITVYHHKITVYHYKINDCLPTWNDCSTT